MKIGLTSKQHPFFRILEVEERLQPKKKGENCFPGNEKEKEVSTGTISLDQGSNEPHIGA